MFIIYSQSWHYKEKAIKMKKQSPYHFGQMFFTPPTWNFMNIYVFSQPNFKIMQAPCIYPLHSAYYDQSPEQNVNYVVHLYLRTEAD